MSTTYQRGMILLSQQRYDLAEAEFRRLLVDLPEDPLARAFLSLCLTRLARDRAGRDEALREAEEAVRLGPDLPIGHQTRAEALIQLDRLKDAEAAAREALRLDPLDADHWALLARVAVGRRQWAEALDATDRGLALDAEHAGCRNLRAMAMVQLGRAGEATATLGSALADDPENALTHANQGWAYLHEGDHKRALEHFREALRIDPELEWARAGIVEALKARHVIYRWMLRFFLWMGRQNTVAMWAVVLFWVFGRRFLAGLAKTYPALAPIVGPILLLTFAFLMLSWIASPLFDSLLRLNRFGRLALSRDQRLASNWIGGCFLLAAVFFLDGLLFRATGLAEWGVAYFGLLLMPLAVTFQQDAGRPRWMMAGYTAAIAALGLPALSILLFGTQGPWKDFDQALSLFGYFMYGAILATWAPLLLITRRSFR